MRIESKSRKKSFLFSICSVDIHTVSQHIKATVRVREFPILTNKYTQEKNKRSARARENKKKAKEKETHSARESFFFSFSLALVFLPLYLQLLCSVCLYRVCCSTFCGVSFFLCGDDQTRNSNSVFVFRFGNAILLFNDTNERGKEKKIFNFCLLSVRFVINNIRTKLY